jgi:hypothetical protein
MPPMKQVVKVQKTRKTNNALGPLARRLVRTFFFLSFLSRLFLFRVQHHHHERADAKGSVCTVLYREDMSE